MRKPLLLAPIEPRCLWGKRTRLRSRVMVPQPSTGHMLGLVVLVIALVGHLWMHADHPLDSHLEHSETPATTSHRAAQAGEADPAQPQTPPHLTMLAACLVILSALLVSLLRDRPLRSRLPFEPAAPPPSRGSQAPPDPVGPPTPVASGVLLRV